MFYSVKDLRQSFTTLDNNIQSSFVYSSVPTFIDNILGAKISCLRNSALNMYQNFHEVRWRLPETRCGSTYNLSYTAISKFLKASIFQNKLQFLFCSKAT
jgi:hypothetical protein